MRLLNNLQLEILYAFKVFKTAFYRINNKSDFKRWEAQSSLKEDWDTRTKLIAELIPANSKVLEFGAGRMILKEHLPIGCSYTPSDIVDRGPGTIVCDLNKGVPKITQHDCTVFSGVMEYVYDIRKLINHLKNNTDIIIASYATKELNSKYRKWHGWINNYCELDFIKIFQEGGFELVNKKQWKKQPIFLFKRKQLLLKH